MAEECHSYGYVSASLPIAFGGQDTCKDARDAIPVQLTL